MAASSNITNERSLTVLVIDVSPVAWGRNDKIRELLDEKRRQQNKSGTVGPGILEELLSSVQAFASATLSLDRDAALLIIGVAGSSDVAVVYPRKDQLEEYFANPTESTLDIRRIQQDVLDGVTELINRAAKRIIEIPDEEEVSRKSKDDSPDSDKEKEKEKTPSPSPLPSMASGFSLALCLINRFMVAAHSGAGVSALHNHHTWERGNGDDEGIILALGGSANANGGGSSKRSTRTGWSPRILFLQLSDDLPSSFNAMMNCTFASVKQNVVVDGCYLSKNENDHSPFLQQACDMTGGLYLTPKGPSQTGHFLTEILMSVFLPPRSCRNRLKLPAIDEVDFRARAFDTGNIVDQAYVCNSCLSIWENKPSGVCPTCDSEIKQSKKQKPATTNSSSNSMRK